MQKKLREWNQTQVVVRLVSFFAMSALTLSFVVFLALEKSARHFLDQEISVLLTSIETGPVEFSRLNSRDFSEQQLVRLMEASNRDSLAFREALITSGQDNQEIHAAWRAVGEASKSCEQTIDRNLNFKDSIFPYRIRLIVDSCQAQKRFGPIQNFLFTVIFLCFLFLIAATGYAVSPVVSSIRNASKIFKTGLQKPEIEAGLALIPYRPLKEITEQALRSRELEREAAIARTTQMLAHDVRKPFSMLKMALEMISGAESPDEIKELSQSVLPEVQRAMGSVNGLIQDVMEIGTNSVPVGEDAKPQDLIALTLKDLLQIYPNSSVSFEYLFAHRNLVSVDVGKVVRVFSNIVGNAMQAIHFTGHVWFSTNNVVSDGVTYVQFSIGNSGTEIAQSDLSQLFEAFFTKNKKGGTGLGLAIAQKIVLAHGGRIWCESAKTSKYPDGYVEFFFTLPASTSIDTPNEQGLPKSSTTSLSSSEIVESKRAQLEKMSRAEHDSELELKGRLQNRNAPISILIVDDEPVYRNALKSALLKADRFTRDLRIEIAQDADSALALTQNSFFELVILDVDLGTQSANGFEIVGALRESGCASFICIHSNRTLASDHKTSIEAGADAFLPKPMSRAHLLKLVLQAIPAEKDVEEITGGKNVIAESKVASLEAREQSKMAIAFVDDSATMRTIWKRKLKDTDFFAFASPEAFWSAVSQGQLKVEELSCVISDYHFGSASFETGRSFAEAIREKSNIPIFICSDGEFELSHFEGAVTRVIAKNVLSEFELKTLLTEVSR